MCISVCVCIFVTKKVLSNKIAVQQQQKRKPKKKKTNRVGQVHFYPDAQWEAYDYIKHKLTSAHIL